MVIIIYLGILLINVVAVFMVYKFLGTDMEKGKINFHCNRNIYNVCNSIICLLAKYKKC